MIHQVDETGKRVIQWKIRILKPESVSRYEWNQSKSNLEWRASLLGINPNELRDRMLSLSLPPPAGYEHLWPDGEAASSSAGPGHGGSSRIGGDADAPAGEAPSTLVDAAPMIPDDDDGYYVKDLQYRKCLSE